MATDLPTRVGPFPGISRADSRWAAPSPAARRSTDRRGWPSARSASRSGRAASGSAWPRSSSRSAGTPPSRRRWRIADKRARVAAGHRAVPQHQPARQTGTAPEQCDARPDPCEHALALRPGAGPGRSRRRTAARGAPTRWPRGAFTGHGRGPQVRSRGARRAGSRGAEGLRSPAAPAGRQRGRGPHSKRAARGSAPLPLGSRLLGPGRRMGVARGYEVGDADAGRQSA